jgi:hypothetical protein
MNGQNLNNQQKQRNLEKEYNLKQKRLFSSWLNGAIDQNDYNIFKESLEIIGKEWAVLRTVKRESRSTFYKHLWDERINIRNGKYAEWCDSKKNDAYSYESKICFLISPKFYKLIYDDRNHRNLYNLQKSNKKFEEKLKEKSIKITSPNSDKSAIRKKWQEIADLYYDLELHGRKHVADDEDYYEIDYDSWRNGAK